MEDWKNWKSGRKEDGAMRDGLRIGPDLRAGRNKALDGQTPRQANETLLE